MVKINLEAKEVELIVSIAQKIIIEMDKPDPQEILDMQADKDKDYAIDNMIRESEDQHDMTGRPGPGNCECHDG